jgi:hypothetical protein
MLTTQYIIYESRCAVCLKNTLRPEQLEPAAQSSALRFPFRMPHATAVPILKVSETLFHWLLTLNTRLYQASIWCSKILIIFASHTKEITLIEDDWEHSCEENICTQGKVTEGWRKLHNVELHNLYSN